VKANPTALIVGAGISGLVCAHALRKAGVNTLVLEAGDEPGGVIRSQRREGYLIEQGPQSFSETPPIRALCTELGLESSIVRAPARAPRYVVVNGELRQVPLTPPAFLTSSLFGLRTKWSLARDAFGTSHAPDRDESVADFVRRKFSAELLDKLVGPFISGIYAGDPELLSLRSAFPQLRDAEQSAGSIIRGLRKRSKAASAPPERPTVMSFTDGNQTLLKALATNLGSILRFGTRVIRIEQFREQAPPGWEITSADTTGKNALSADHLILATPADIAANLLLSLDPAFESLNCIEYAPVSVVSMGYRRSEIKNALNGFGFLVPRSERLRILGTVWNSSLFPGRAPQDHALLTTFVGGATDPQAAAMPPEETVALVHRDIAPILGITQPPAFSAVERYDRAIPQYNLGHADLLAQAEQARVTLPNLHFVGNYWQGPSVGACVEHATRIAAEVAAQVARLTS
jgi:protoporphyrinogen/coproporphyrinogen III oxidase